jgi:acetyltransferase-like isoleucine patch superfamily enzyme
MLIIGTGGLAGDMLFSLQFEFTNSEIAFYNDTDLKVPDYVRKDFTLINNLAEAEYYFKTTDNRFLAAVGDNVWRHYLSQKFEKIGGVNKTYISKEARVGNYNHISPKGVIILADAHITNDIVIDEGVIFYLRAGIGHYSHLHPYCLISGGCNTSSVDIGAYATVGINVGIKPSTQIGKFSMLGTGAVIVKDVDEYAVMVGNPAKKISTTLPHITQFLSSHPEFSPF